MAIPENIEARLAGLGLVMLGVVESDEAVRLLVGNTGGGLWPVFSSSPEYGDGRPDPLDRWTRRVGKAMADELDAAVVFPFDGPPYPPFLKWAAESGEASGSPIGMNIHHRLGLWHAYRFCLELKQNQSFADETRSDRLFSVSPCLDCRFQPCLTACPVSAFDGSRYKVDACVGSLAGEDRGECMENGCAARRACPVAHDQGYPSVQAAFHMLAFLKAHPLSTESTDQGFFEEMPGG